MSRPDAWMPLYIADYLADTAHLSAAQSGAYLHLIMAYWRRGGPLPLEDSTLARTARMTEGEWSQNRDIVLAFFSTEGGTIRHKRIDSEIAKASDTYDRTVERGRKAATARWKRHASSMQQASAKHCSSTAQALLADAQPQPQPQPQSPTEIDIDHRVSTTDQLDFAEFWAAYPRKVGKGQARRAFKAAVAKAPVRVMLDALERQRPGWTDPQYIPHPATWLNGERWTDEPPERRMTPIEEGLSAWLTNRT